MLTACIWHHNLFPFLYISLCSLETHTLGRGSLMSHLDLQSVIPHNSATCRSELSRGKWNWSSCSLTASSQMAL
ncbi:hypothetical protein BX666DRAFT_1954841 [Dichotomocladium elegans]|nr:hypothetical protein BX666DRAFT_1954841 [Dichotomocladium elegans]